MVVGPFLIVKRNFLQIGYIILLFHNWGGGGHCGLLKKDKNGAVIPVGGGSMADLPDYYNLHVNKGDKIKPVYDEEWISHWRSWCGNGSIPQKANTETSGLFSTMWDTVTCNIVQGATFYPYKESSGNTSVDYVIENFRDGATWYRKWNSGFLEQGGESTNQITTEFKTYFIDNLYTINGNFIGEGTNDKAVTGRGTHLGFNTLTPSSFFAVASWTTGGGSGNTTSKMKFRWKAEGYWK